MHKFPPVTDSLISDQSKRWTAPRTLKGSLRCRRGTQTPEYRAKSAGTAGKGQCCTGHCTTFQCNVKSWQKKADKRALRTLGWHFKAQSLAAHLTLDSGDSHLPHSHMFCLSLATCNLLHVDSWTAGFPHCTLSRSRVDRISLFFSWKLSSRASGLPKPSVGFDLACFDALSWILYKPVLSLLSGHTSSTCLPPPSPAPHCH